MMYRSNFHIFLLHYIPATALQLQRETRKDINAERRDAEKELRQKREATERRVQGKGRGRGQGRGRKAPHVEPMEEGVPGKEQDEAAEHLPEKNLQELRSKRGHESEDDIEDSDLEARKGKR